MNFSKKNNNTPYIYVGVFKIDNGNMVCIRLQIIIYIFLIWPSLQKFLRNSLYIYLDKTHGRDYDVFSRQNKPVYQDQALLNLHSVSVAISVLTCFQ